MNYSKLIVGRISYWLGLPALFFYLQMQERTRLVLKVGDDVLVLKGWLGSGRWMLPGGGMHDDERPAEAVLRELHEETGIHLKEGQLTYHGRHQAHDSEGLRYVYHVFVATLPDIPEVHLQASEIYAGEWLSVDALSASKAVTKTTRHILETWSRG